MAGYLPVCTWAGCLRDGKHPQLNGQGNQWANLCDEHNTEHEAALASLNPKQLIRAWIKAIGGAKQMAGKMAPEVTVTGKLLAHWLSKLEPKKKDEI